MHKSQELLMSEQDNKCIQYTKVQQKRELMPQNIYCSKRQSLAMDKNKCKLCQKGTTPAIRKLSFSSSIVITNARVN
jgi:hypothetical protein